MKKAISQKIIGLCAGTLVSLSFSAAVAGEPAPVISKERENSIRLCVDKLQHFTKQLDTRQGENLEHYYYDNNANMVAVKTAVQTGLYDKDIEKLSLLGQIQSTAAFNLVMNRGFHCAILADENGDIGDARGGQDVLKTYTEFTNQLVHSSNSLMDIVKMLKSEGDKLIESGITPADRDAPVFLFN